MLQERELRPDMTINSGRGENEGKGNKENGISDVGRKKGVLKSMIEIRVINMNNWFGLVFSFIRKHCSTE